MQDFQPFIDLALEYAQEKGADFCEVRAEKTTSLSIRLEKEIVRSIQSSQNIGIGITVVVKGSRGHGFTGSLTNEDVRKAVDEAIQMAKATSKHVKLSAEPIEYSPKNYKGFVPSQNRHPKDISLEEKIDLIKSGASEILGNDDVVSVLSAYGEYWGEIIFENSEGLKRKWNPLKNGVLYYVVVRKNGEMGNGYEQFASSYGFEIYDKKDPRDLAHKALKGARDAAVAKTLKPGKYGLIADPNFVGVIAHESFGHLTEGDYVATKSSILYGRLGEKVGSNYATIVESGDPINYGFFIPYDDEGVATEKVILLEKGILKGYLHSRSTAKIMGMEPTGNARAISFKYPSIVRMRNTYFMPGDMTKDELFEILKNGVYAEGSTGGQTEDTGNFTFGANRAYWFEDGEIKYPIKGATVRANILDFLKNVVGASKELVVHTSVFGGCGKGGQMPLPVGDGGPYMAIKEALVGGGV